MSNPAWKQDEYAVARKLGGVRVPLSGGRGAFSKADVLAGNLFIEVKRRPAFRYSSILCDLALKAVRENRVPVLVVHVEHTREWYCILDLDDFVRLGLANGSLRDDDVAVVRGLVERGESGV